MILSSADILRVLGGSAVIRLSARLSIVDSKPVLSGAEGLFVYINRFPTLDEFEATWTLWIESDGSEPDDLIVSEIKRLLPNVTTSVGLLTTLTTTDFRSENTQRAPEAPRAKEVSTDLSSFEDRFQELSEGLEDRMLMVSSGRPGKDGQDGRNGVDGRDGKDLDATETELFGLKNVEQSVLPMEKGQVLTWDGTKWTNLYPRETTAVISGGNGSSTDGEAGISEAPQDGNYYVRASGTWVKLLDALSSLGVPFTEPVDAGDFTTGLGTAITNKVYDGGNFTNGNTTATDGNSLDGGLTTG